MHLFATSFTYKSDYSPNSKIRFHDSPTGQAGEGLRRPASFPSGWKEATAAAAHIEQIIVNEKSLRGIMLSTGSLLTFPPSALGAIRRSGVFSLSFGIQELLPGN